MGFWGASLRKIFTYGEVVFWHQTGTKPSCVFVELRMMKLSGFAAAIIYVLRLEQRKFYVGKTDLPVQRRFLEHRRGRGAEWTRRFPPIAIDLEIRETSPYCEDKTVKQYMGMFGIENVRGGSYSKVVLDAVQLEALRREILHANDRCLGCGLPGHFLINCPFNKAKIVQNKPSTQKKETISFGQLLDTNTCYRCGRQGHWSSRCSYALHVNGRPTVRQKKARSQSFKHFTKPQSPRTAHGRNGSALRQLNSSSPGMQKLIAYTCYRCGRKGHLADSCFCRYHKDGRQLPFRKKKT
jgi:hypothetical protein